MGTHPGGDPAEPPVRKAATVSGGFSQFFRRSPSHADPVGGPAYLPGPARPLPWRGGGSFQCFSFQFSAAPAPRPMKLFIAILCAAALTGCTLIPQSLWFRGRVAPATEN